MKIKSLLLGSLALAGVSGLAAGAQAADLAKGVMTSLDVCDALGISGLTISSDTDCLALSGGVSYMFAWGDYEVGAGSAATGLRLFSTPDDNTEIPIAGGSNGTANGQTDWDTQMIAWLQATASADSDFGVAKAVIKLKSEEYRHAKNGFGYYDGDDTGGSTTNVGNGEGTTGDPDPEHSNGPSGTVLFDKAYVSVGDSTVLTAGQTGSIVNTGDDTPLNWLGLFNASNTASGGVLWSVSNRAGGGTAAYANPQGGASEDHSGADVQTGGHSIQIVSSLGNGLTLSGGLEDIQDANEARAGTAIGVISYAGDNLTAHLSVIETGVLDGHPDYTAYHAGFTGTFDKFKLIAAIAGDSSGYWDGLASGQATFDMFKLAASVEGGGYSTAGGDAVTAPNWDTDNQFAGHDFLGFGGSASMTVSDGVTINIGGRYFDADTSRADTEGYQAAVSLVAAVTETLTLEGDVGVYGTNDGGYGTDSRPGAGTAGGVDPTSGSTLGFGGSSGCTRGTYCNVEYGAASVTWAPGGGFTSSLKGEAYTNGAYRATFNAAKSFQ